jgi:iron complex transport system substrate-binding protein
MVVAMRSKFGHVMSALVLLMATALCSQAQAQSPSRVVLGGKAVLMVADLVYAFPQARSAVAAAAGTDQGLGSFLSAVDPSFDRLPALDKAAGAEAYAAQRPDLVILKSTMKKSLGAQLDALGLRTLYLDLESPDDYFRDIAALGTAFGATPGVARGAKDRARELSAYYEGVLKRVAAPPRAAARPRVLVVQASLAGGGAFDVPPKSWIQSAMVGLAGGDAVWLDANPGQGWGRVSYEQIAAWNPDLLIVIDYREGVDGTVAALKADVRFASLACGRSGRILGFPQDWYSWDQPDTRWGLGLLWMAKVLRPADFVGMDLLAEARAFYRLFYGFDDAAFAAKVLPRLKGDYALAE